MQVLTGKTRDVGEFTLLRQTRLQIGFVRIAMSSVPKQTRVTLALV
jgi:hypothetical protein